MWNSSFARSNPLGTSPEVASIAALCSEGCAFCEAAPHPAFGHD